MNDGWRLEDKSSNLLKIVVYGLSFGISSLVAIIYLLSSGNLAPKIVTSAIAIILFGLFGMGVTAKFRTITMYPDKITTGALFRSYTVPIEEITSIKIEFSEYVEGFTRMRFLGSILQGDRLPTALSYEIETDDYVLHDTLQNIEQSRLVEFISEIEHVIGKEPQVREFDDEEMRGNVFYFQLKSSD